MSAIYQRARPVNWDEVIGQEHVKDVLRAALERGRVGHAYLFSGPRGVGKTTTARLIAMTANCERDGKKPCGECPSCLAVRAGSHPDVREIDAASNNSVDDVRELRENVALAAMRGGKKIYILDEAHMMSRAAFNALLKTLEEPPSHVIFVLATTEPEKILPTILSRCQHYRFRRLTDTEIAGKLAGICAREGALAEPEALALIGRLADGAMRDGESLLERMLAAGGTITRTGVEAALGLPPSERVAEMARALALGEASPLLEGAGRLYREGYAARTVVEGLKTALRDALHAELGLSDGTPLEGAEVPRLLRLQAALDEQEARFSRGADLLSLELALTHALLAGDSPATAGAAPSTGAAASPDLTARLARLEREVQQLRAAPPAPRAAPAPGGDLPDFDPASRRPPAARPEPAREPAPREEAPPPAPQGTWPDVLRLADMKLRAFLKVARANVAANGAVIVTYDERHKFHAKQVMEKFDDVAALVTKVYGPVDVELVTPEGSKKKGAARDRAEGPAPIAQAVQAAVREVRAEVRDVSASFEAPGPTAAPPTRQAPPAPSLDDLPDFSPRRAAPAQPAPAPSTPARPAPARPAPAPADLPDFSPRGAPARPAPSVAAAAPPTTAPTTAVTSAPAPASPPPFEIYDPEPIDQEPVWEDDGPPLDAAPPRAEAAPTARPPAPSAAPASPPAAARIAPPVDTPWDDLGTGPAPSAPSRAGPAATEPAPAPTRPVGKNAGAAVRAHPLFQEATRMFSGRVRDAGTLRRPKAAAPEAEGADGGEPGELGPGEIGSGEAG